VVVLTALITAVVAAVIITSVHSFRLKQSRSREVRVRSWMALLQVALEDFAGDDRGCFPGGMDAASPSGETIKDYLAVMHGESPETEEILTLFKPSGENGWLLPAPGQVPEGEIWVYTDATSELECNATMYSIYGGGIGGRVIELGMVYRQTELAVGLEPDALNTSGSSRYHVYLFSDIILAEF